MKKFKKTKKDLQHAAPVSQRRKLKKSTSVALQQQLDLPDQKDSLAVLKIKKELRRRTLIVRFAIVILILLILMAVFFLVRAIVQNSASNQRSLSFPISTQDDAPLDIHVSGNWMSSPIPGTPPSIPRTHPATPRCSTAVPVRFRWAPEINCSPTTREAIQSNWMIPEETSAP